VPNRSITSALLACGLLFPAGLIAQGPGIPPSTRQTFPADPKASVPALTQFMRTTTSELAEVITRFAADQQSLQRRYDAPDSKQQRARMRAFYTSWREQLAALDFGRLSQEGKVDYVLLDNHVRYQLDLMGREDRQFAEIVPLLPFADTVLALHETRRNLVSINAQQAAHTLAVVTKQVDSLRALLEPAPPRVGGDSARAPRAVAPKVSRTAGNRAADRLDQVRATLGTWYRFYAGFDPIFTWWAANPYQKLDEAMRRYAQTIRQRCRCRCRSPQRRGRQ